MKLLSFLPILLLSISACSKDDNTPVKETSQNISDSTALHRVWKLVRFEPGFSPTQYFNNGEIKWHFNVNNSLQVSIDSGTYMNPLMPIRNAGIYNYQVLKADTISVDSILYRYKIQNDTLLINDNLPADGKRFTFKAIN